MPVRYNGFTLRPAPFVAISKTRIHGPDGRFLRNEIIFTLQGTIVNVDSAQDSPGAQSATGMEGVLEEQERLRDIFGDNGDSGRLEIEAPNGGGPSTIDAYCTVESINFSPDKWVNRCEFSITLKSSVIEDEDVRSDLSNFSENWSIQENPNSTYGISHQLQATGILLYSVDGENDSLDAARQWVYDRVYPNDIAGNLNPNSLPPSFQLNTLINSLPNASGTFWNRSVVENSDPVTHSWSLTETFVNNPSGIYREEWQASVNKNVDDPNKATLSIAGSVFGFADKDSNRTLKLSRAKDAWENTVQPYLYTRLISYAPSGYSVSPLATSQQYTLSQTEGLVSYSFNFFATRGGLIPNSLEESIDIQDIGSNDVFAQIGIPGRAQGGLIQNMRTISLPERTVTISAVMLPSGGPYSVGSILSAYLSKPNTDAIINALKPSAGNYYVKSNNESYQPIKRVYSRSMSWLLDPGNSSVDGVPARINNLG